MKKDKTSLKLMVPSDLSDKGRQDIADSLNPLVADAFALYVKTKNFHWHLSGPHFRDYHLLFDEQADQIFATIDIIAERVRKLGKTTVRSIHHIASLQTIKDSDEEFLEAKKMVEILLKDNQKMVVNLRKAHDVVDKHNDSATASFLEIFIDETERRVWFLFEILQGDK